MNHYTAVAEREGRWWVVTVPELDIATQARRIDQVEHMARDLIAVWLDVDYDTVKVQVSVHIPDEWRADAERYRAIRAEAQRLEAQASEQARAVARRLRADGVPVRDVGAVLGISPQRVSQLLKAG